MPREDLPFCDCGWLERAARDGTCAIHFDPELNEYHLTATDGGSFLIYHCPFCAGRAPESLRAQMFATVSPEEATRLHRLTQNLKTEKQVLKLLGVPTEIFDPGEMNFAPDKDDKPGEIRAWKSLRYANYSDTATINVNVDRHGKVHTLLSGKYLGKTGKG